MSSAHRVSWLQPDTVGAQQQRPAGGNDPSAGLGGWSGAGCYGCPSSCHPGQWSFALGGSSSPGPTSASPGDEAVVGWWCDPGSGVDGKKDSTLCSAVRHRRAWSRHSAATRMRLTSTPAAAATATGIRPAPSPPTATATKAPPIMLVVTATMVEVWDSRCQLE